MVFAGALAEKAIGTREIYPRDGILRLDCHTFHDTLMTSLVEVSGTLAIDTFITLDLLCWRTSVLQLEGRSTFYNY